MRHNDSHVIDVVWSKSGLLLKTKDAKSGTIDAFPGLPP